MPGSSATPSPSLSLTGKRWGRTRRVMRLASGHGRGRVCGGVRGETVTQSGLDNIPSSVKHTLQTIHHQLLHHIRLDTSWLQFAGRAHRAVQFLFVHFQHTLLLCRSYSRFRYLPSAMRDFNFVTILTRNCGTGIIWWIFFQVM